MLAPKVREDIPAILLLWLEEAPFACACHVAGGVGGDPIVGTNFAELVAALENDPATDSVVLYGEPGGTAEEDLAEMLLQRGSRLRINAFLSGRFVDDMEGVRFGHAAVIVEQGRGSIAGKQRALREAGVFVVERFDDVLEGLPAGFD